MSPLLASGIDAIEKNLDLDKKPCVQTLNIFSRQKLQIMCSEAQLFGEGAIHHLTFLVRWQGRSMGRESPLQLTTPSWRIKNINTCSLLKLKPI